MVRRQYKGHENYIILVEKVNRLNAMREIRVILHFIWFCKKLNGNKRVRAAKKTALCTYEKRLNWKD